MWVFFVCFSSAVRLNLAIPSPTRSVLPLPTVPAPTVPATRVRLGGVAILLIGLLVGLGLCSGGCWAICLVRRRRQSRTFRQHAVPLNDIEENSIPPIITDPGLQPAVFPVPFGVYPGQPFTVAQQLPPQPAHLLYPTA
jgi:hypothetical protein